ncbi:MAG: Gfo/Idh/MocA family oxidoreductase [Candidatus Thorarchaeota archaeon]
MTVKIGIVGLGNMGSIHARILGSQRLLTAVADLNYERAKQVASAYRVSAYDSVDSMLQGTDIDGVIIATPTSTHAQLAINIARNYDVKGLLIEKPIASSLREAQEVARVLNGRGIVTIVSHSEIYNPVVDRALMLIKQGAIGVPKTVIHERRGFVLPSRIPSLGDVFEDIGVHDFDIMSRITQGRATLFALCNKVEEMCNAATVMVGFEHGTIHVFHLSRQYAGRVRSLDVTGTHGALTIDLFGQILKVQDLDQEPLADGRAIRLPERGATIKVYGEPIQEVVNDFLRCMTEGCPPRVGLEDGIRALAVVEAARESIRQGNPVSIEIAPRSQT